MRQLESVVLFCLGLALVGCATTQGSYVWLQDYSAPPRAQSHETIHPGDLIGVRVWNSQQMDSHQRVREDGTISLFFVDDIHVADRTPAEAAQEVARRLAGVLQSPQVNVVLEESVMSNVSVLGEVSRPGSFSVLAAPTLLRAIAAAQGLTEYAHRDRIFVLRRTPQPVRIRASYESLIRGDKAANGFSLQAGDVVVVE
jgi:polysaccharide export outer membrane protein